MHVILSINLITFIENTHTCPKTDIEIGQLGTPCIQSLTLKIRQAVTQLRRSFPFSLLALDKLIYFSPCRWLSHWFFESSSNKEGSAQRSLQHDPPRRQQFLQTADVWSPALRTQTPTGLPTPKGRVRTPVQVETWCR